jgi:glyoxylase-like metal-dependent hydrolase (beta-lactamase superfamily II)
MVLLENQEAAMQQTILVKPDVKGFYESRTGSIQYVISDPMTGQSAIIDPVLDFDEKSEATATRSADMILDYLHEKWPDR